jgi:hypothetical protein
MTATASVLLAGLNVVTIYLSCKFKKFQSTGVDNLEKVAFENPRPQAYKVSCTLRTPGNSLWESKGGLSVSVSGQIGKIPEISQRVCLSCRALWLAEQYCQPISILCLQREIWRFFILGLTPQYTSHFLKVGYFL